MATIISAILLFSFFFFSLFFFSTPIDDQWSLATATYTRVPFQAGGGACGYSLEAEERPEWMSELGRNTAALSGELFRRGEVCGSCFELRCVDHILFCLPGSPAVTVTAVDFCAPNYGISSGDGGWCNFPRHHFEVSLPAFASIARSAADIVPEENKQARVLNAEPDDLSLLCD